MPERFAGKASFHPEAEKEFLEAAGEYATESDDLADEFAAEVRRGIESILEYPEMAPAIGHKRLRGRVLQRFPYTLCHRARTRPAPRGCASETAARLLGIEDLKHQRNALV